MMNATDRYDSLIAYLFEQEAARLGFDETVDWHLVKAQVRAESAFDPEAVSPVGARGLLQIMPATWGANFERDAFNPEKNLARGIEHLGFLWGMFKDEQGWERWRFALGAYNCGQGHVIEAQKRLAKVGRPTDSWLEIAQVLPTITGPANAKQTTEYVRAIVSDYLAGKDA
jgi:soluble lytic murein transglycosylase-like protein